MAGGEAEAGRIKKVAIGTLSHQSDVSWGWGHYKMFEFGKKKHPDVEFVFADKVPWAETESTLINWATRGIDFIQVGSAFIDAVKAVAPRYPKVKFGITDGYLKGPNIQTVDWKTEQGGYLCGVLAARMTKTKVVGYIGGMDYPDIVRVGEAFKLGAQSVDPSMKVLRVYLGSWTDQALAYETASAMADKGTDVFIHIADMATFGIYKLINERKLMVIGVNHFEQVQWLPDRTLGVLAHGFENVFERNFHDAESDTFGNKIISYGLQNGWEQIQLVMENLPVDVVDHVLMVQRDIACGKITVPIITKPTD